MQDYKLAVLANPVVGREAEFDEWYDIHVREIVQTKYVVGAQQFRGVDRGEPELQSPYRSLVIADWRADDLEASWSDHYQAFKDAVAAGTMTPLTPSFDASSAQHWFFREASPYRRDSTVRR